ncbi:MAG TPA: SDR family NAD(P)-dependent oxidoreductase, partial [Alphaproteobacteria bacterium]|nr:SDR family NAD(P)-dependent oxidoreductase [Alphaproteobacteria bacterium]
MTSASETGRVVVVTGAARGIGAAIARTLGRDGWAVSVADLDQAAATRTAERVAEETGAHTLGVAVDIADTASVREMVDHVARALGPVTALVNNAGIDVIKPFV